MGCDVQVHLELTRTFVTVWNEAMVAAKATSGKRRQKGSFDWDGLRLGGAGRQWGAWVDDANVTWRKLWFQVWKAVIG